MGKLTLRALTRRGFFLQRFVLRKQAFASYRSEPISGSVSCLTDRSSRAEPAEASTCPAVLKASSQMLPAAFSSLSNRHPQGANMICGRGETRCAPTCEPWHRSRNSFGSYQRDEQQQLSPPTFYQTVLARCGTCTKQHH